MINRGEIQTKLTRMLYAASASTYFSPEVIAEAISDANLWAGDEKPWPDIKRGFITSTEAGSDYYDYPDNCQSESIFRIMIDGNSKYKKTDFEDFLTFKEDHPTSNDKLFSEYDRKIFIFPTPLVDGVSNFIQWGLIQAGGLPTAESLTMFSGWADSANEGILQKAYSDLTQNIDPNKANDALTKALSIINKAYLKIAKRQQRKQRVDKAMFNVPDYFGSGNSGSRINNFQTDEE